MEFGISNVMIREIARSYDLIQKYFDNIFMFKLIISVLSLVLVSITMWAINYSIDIVIATLLLSFSMMLYSLSSVASSVFYGIEKMEFIAYSSLIAKGVAIIFGVLFLLLQTGFLWIVSVLLIERIVEIFINLFLLKKRNWFTLL